jgi:hypothetical protein
MKALDLATRISLKNTLYVTDFSPSAGAALPLQSHGADKVIPIPGR